jgi:hypothetical protein
MLTSSRKHFGEEMREERQLQFFVPVARLKENPFEKLLGIRRSSCGSKTRPPLARANVVPVGGPIKGQ